MDDLPPTQHLIMEVLAARWRLGEVWWTFPSRLRPALVALENAGLVSFKAGVVHKTLLASLTNAGLSQWIFAGYNPPQLEA